MESTHPTPHAFKHTHSNVLVCVGHAYIPADESWMSGSSTPMEYHRRPSGFGKAECSTSQAHGLTTGCSPETISSKIRRPALPALSDLNRAEPAGGAGTKKRKKVDLAFIDIALPLQKSRPWARNSCLPAVPVDGFFDSKYGEPDTPSSSTAAAAGNGRRLCGESEREITSICASGRRNLLVVHTTATLCVQQ